MSSAWIGHKRGGSNLSTPTPEDEGKMLVIEDSQYKLVDIATIKG